MEILQNCCMAAYTTFKTGKNADWLLQARGAQEAAEAIAFAKGKNLPFMIIGNGSNILFAHDYHGVVIKVATDSLSRLAKEYGRRGLSGLEFASGIPGSLGGAVYMNAGAYGGEMGQVLKTVTSMDADGNLHERSAAECGFGYRKSIFMENHEIILSAEFTLTPDDPAAIEARMADLAKKRAEKQPLSYPSAGSFFKRPEGFFAGKLIEDAGLKGLQIGGAQISDLHAGFLINKDNASVEDILDLMKVVQETVMNKFGVSLQPEVQIV